MYKDSLVAVNTDVKKKNKFAMLFNIAVERGRCPLPAMTKRQCLSIRSQLNRYRANSRGNPGTDKWDLVMNNMEDAEDGLFRLVMTYPKRFWDEVDVLLEIPNIPMMLPEVDSHIVMAPEGTKNITDLLDSMYAPGNADK